jgi:hypothetical protein
LFELIIELDYVNLDITDYRGATGLCYACDYKYNEIALKMIKKGIKIFTFWEEGYPEYGALGSACRGKLFDVIDAIIEHNQTTIKLMIEILYNYRMYNQILKLCLENKFYINYLKYCINDSDECSKENDKQNIIEYFTNNNTSEVINFIGKLKSEDEIYNEGKNKLRNKSENEMKEIEENESEEEIEDSEESEEEIEESEEEEAVEEIEKIEDENNTVSFIMGDTYNIFRCQNKYL